MSDTVTPHDLFAAAALTGILSCEGGGAEYMKAHCLRAYAWADAMVRERGPHIPDVGKKAENTEKIDAARYERVMSSIVNGGSIGRDVSQGDTAAALLFAERVARKTLDRLRDVTDSVCGVESGLTAGDGPAIAWLDAIEQEYHRVRIELAKQKTIAERLAEEVDAKLERTPEAWAVINGPHPAVYAGHRFAHEHAGWYGGTAVPLYRRANEPLESTPQGETGRG